MLVSNGDPGTVDDKPECCQQRWAVGGAAKLFNLAKTADADVLKAIVIKLQKRVKAGAASLLIKVKAHGGDPLNEEADIRAEMGRMKEERGENRACQPIEPSISGRRSLSIRQEHSSPNNWHGLTSPVF